MRRFFHDQGIILKKKNILRDDKLITIFTKEQGKITLFAKGVKRITSRRLPHLDTGNLIKFFYYKKNYDFQYLRESEIIYGFPYIKKSLEKINFFYSILFIIERLLPESQKEKILYQKLLFFLKKLEKELKISQKDFDDFLKEIIIELGYISSFKAKDKRFDVIKFIEELINSKILFFLS